MSHEVKKLLSQKPKNGRFYLVAIDGRGGSGKTELAKHIRKLLPDFMVLNGDDYFEPADDGVIWGRFNDHRFTKEVIKPLKTTNTFKYRPYDWHKTPNITESKIVVEQGLVLERVHSFGFDLDWDLKIWVDTPKETCFKRGVARDHTPDGREVKVWQIWQKDEDEYITQYHPKEVADIVVDGNTPFAEQLK